jgi:hypothetical protein
MMHFYVQFVTTHLPNFFSILMKNEVLEMEIALNLLTYSPTIYFYFLTDQKTKRNYHVVTIFLTWKWHVRLESVTAVMVKIQILCDVTLCRWVCTSQHLKVSCSFRTLGSHTHPISQRQIPEDLNCYGSDMFQHQDAAKICKKYSKLLF